MKIIVSHLTLNANAKAVVSGLLNKGFLFKIYTSIAVFSNQYLFSLTNLKFLKDFKRRKLPLEWKYYTKYLPYFELGRLLASKFKVLKFIEHEKGIFSVDKVYQKHDKWVSKQLKHIKKKGVNAVYAYEDGALQTFIEAKKQGIYCIYDLPIGYWKSARELMEEELEKNPEWSSTLTGFKDSEEKLKRKDKELELSDIIFVASSFTKKTLQMYNGKLPEIKVIPYGFPEVGSKKKYESLKGRKLKVLFIGGLSQRKGISYLFQAAEILKDKIELTIVGRRTVDDCEVLNESLEKHNWIPSLPHDKILECMRVHDIFVFPSLFEGFGLVVTEAMSQGTPVITTERTCGPDIIKDGENGWLIKSGSTNSLVDKLNEIINNPSCIEKVGREALKTATKRPWQHYGNELVQAIRDL